MEVPEAECKNQTTQKETTCYIGRRYILTLFMFFGYFNVTFLRTNLSIAIVAMVDPTVSSPNGSDSNTGGGCPSENITAQHRNIQPGTFQWNSLQQGTLLGCYFYGYIASSIPGPWIAKKVGFKLVIGASMLLSSVITILGPITAYNSLELFIASRILLGLLQGAVIPTLSSAFPAWIPLQERDFIFSICASGFSVGAFVTLPLGSAITESVGWEAVFYITGSITLLWSLLWFTLVYDSPAAHPWISSGEREYIEKNTGLTKLDIEEPRKRRIPWLDLMTSLPMWAAIFSHFAYDWSFNTANLLLPTYMANIMKLDMTITGVSAGLPYLIQAGVTVGGGIAANLLIRKRLFHITSIRKMYILPALLVPSAFIILAAYSGCDKETAVLYFIISVSILGLHVPGTEANLFDVSPTNCGIIFGINGAVATSSGFIAPQVAGLVLYPENSLFQWQLVFWINAGINIVAAVFYLIFGSGVEQPWSVKQRDAMEY